MKTYTLEIPPPPGPIPFDRLSDDDRAALRRLAAGKSRIIEIGTFLGGSAETMLDASDAAILCVDTFRGTEGNETAQVQPHLMLSYATMRLRRFGDRATFLVGRSPAVASLVADGSADLIFLDAAHDYGSVVADIRAWLPKMKPGGTFAGHDIYKFDPPQETEDVIRAVHDALGMVWLLGGRDSSVWCKRIA